MGTNQQGFECLCHFPALLPPGEHGLGPIPFPRLGIGVWRSLVARSVRVGEVPGSNPGTPISPCHGPPLRGGPLPWRACSTGQPVALWLRWAAGPGSSSICGATGWGVAAQCAGVAPDEMGRRAKAARGGAVSVSEIRRGRPSRAYGKRTLRSPIPLSDWDDAFYFGDALAECGLDAKDQRGG